MALTSSSPPFTEDQVRRYARHLMLPEVGLDGQEKLRSARVLIVGAGGLGSPVSMYLAAAGVGTIGLVDHDDVEASNLQRQLLYTSDDVGRSKVGTAAERLRGLNPDTQVVEHATSLGVRNAFEILDAYDIVVDGSDNFPTRYLVSDAAWMLGKTLVYGSIFRFEGQVSVFAPAAGSPCYRCLFAEPPPPGVVPSCGEAGVLGVLPGTIGTLQATEVVKLTVGIGEPLIGRLLLYDAATMNFRKVAIPKDPRCALCGDPPRITSLIDYEAFCGTRIPG